MARETFRGAIPDGLWYDAAHDMWLRREDGEIVVGATAFGIFLVGELVAFTAKPPGAVIARGRGLGTIECSKTVLAVHAPVSFVLTTANEQAEAKPRLINADPYRVGWMARGRPLAWDTEAAALVDAAAYRRHVLHMEPGAVIGEST